MHKIGGGYRRTVPFWFALLATTGLGTSGVAHAQNALAHSSPGSEVFFIDLNDGASASERLQVRFGLKGMGIAPAGSDSPNSGHHHLLVDTELPPLNRSIPNDFNHLHFGSGQTEVTITLKPGPHTLQLLLGDKNHIPHVPPVMSPVIHINVVPTGGPTRSAAGAEVYFTELADGASVGSELTVHFELKNMGIAPAGSDRPNSGHHHLLIDADIPPLDQPIPNDFNHLHFGSGQSEATITLTPGEHTLQLLFADMNHIPHTPPLYSKRIAVRVIDPALRTPSPPGAKVYFVGLEEGSTVPQKVTLHFGLAKMGVAPAGLNNQNTGHHHLLIDAETPRLDQPIANDFKHLHFGAGQTEATITLPKGKHTLQLLLGDANHVPHNPPVISERITVMVK